MKKNKSLKLVAPSWRARSGCHHCTLSSLCTGHRRPISRRVPLPAWLTRRLHRTPTPCRPLSDRLTQWRCSQCVHRGLDSGEDHQQEYHACTRRDNATRPAAQPQRPGPPRSSAAFLRLRLASRCSAPHPAQGQGLSLHGLSPTCSPTRPSSRTQTASARSASACSSCSTTSRLRCRA